MSETVAGIVSSRSSHHPFAWRWLLGASLLLGGAYAGALAVTAPAAVIARAVDLPPAIVGLTGTVWQGQAAVDGGSVVGWSVNAAGSLQSRAIAADWTVTGPDTRLSGEIIGSTGRIEIADVSGVVGWSLISAVVADLPVQCDLTARVGIARAALGPGDVSGSGTATTPPMTCRTENGGDVAIPALSSVMAPIEGGVRIEISAREGGERLGSVDLLAKGWMALTLEPAGARLIPGMPSSAATVVEMPIALTIPPLPAR